MLFCWSPRIQYIASKSGITFSGIRPGTSRTHSHYCWKEGGRTQSRLYVNYCNFATRTLPRGGGISFVLGLTLQCTRSLLGNGSTNLYKQSVSLHRRYPSGSRRTAKLNSTSTTLMTKVICYSHRKTTRCLGIHRQTCISVHVDMMVMNNMINMQMIFWLLQNQPFT